MAELLLELLSEEIPARMQARAADDLKRLVTDGLKKAGLDFTDAQAFVTPRRLALVVDGLADRTPDISEERRGPRADAPDNAVAGFKGSLPEGTAIETRETEKGEFYFAKVEQKGGPVMDLLPEILVSALSGLGWPKSMRWAGNKIRWVRPIKGIVCLFAGAVVGVEYGPLAARDTTTGHRFLSPDSFTVTGFADYKDKLEKGHVILDAAERRAKIETDAKALAEAAGFRLKDDPALLDEVAGLVEWPLVLMGAIDDAFMALPDEVLTTSMRKHQKYFAVVDDRDILAPHFIVVANTEPSDGGKAVVAGNERVLRARLADAKFFWDQDLERLLDSRVQALGGRVFHAKLGTVLDKVKRIEVLAAALAEACGANPAEAARAAVLAKADLSTGMVTEFPDLQGVMGRYYALAEGENPGIADAIAEHYSPRGPNDFCPSKPVSVAVALADKIDTLVGFWAIDEKPTGSKDPFALRRAALGVIRLIIENGFRIPLTTVLRTASDTYLNDQMTETEMLVDAADRGEIAGDFGPRPIQKDETLIVSEVLDFVAERLKVHLREKGIRHDLISAVFAVRQAEQEMPGEVDLVRVLARVDALEAFLSTDNGANLLIAYRRAANIVRIESEKDKKSYPGAVDEIQLSAPEEIALFKNLHDIADRAKPHMDAERFVDAMGVLSELREPVDAFFDNVTVNCKEEKLRENRLNLLAYTRWTLDDVADFSKIEGGDK